MARLYTCLHPGGRPQRSSARERQRQQHVERGVHEVDAAKRGVRDEPRDSGGERSPEEAAPEKKPNEVVRTSCGTIRPPIV
jgi:hypothetical protein